VAHGARERLFAGVYAQVLLEQHLPGERLAAVVTTVRLLARVYAHVHVVRHPLVKALRAILALVLLPVPVDLHVRAQVSAVVEQLTALRTATRKLSGALVHGPVVLVVAQLAELFAARLAHERFLARVGPLVDLKGRFGYESFSTFLTNMTFCLIRISVFLRDPIIVSIAGNF
jgi:hypothetical protein